MALLGTDFDPLDPTDSSEVAQGASWIRDMKQRLKDFVTVSFDPETGELLPDAIPNKVTTPYGVAGTVYTSTGPSTDPVWAAGSGVQTGAIFLWASSVIPAGYLALTGGTKNIADYPALAAVVGVTFGGDGVNTFGIPDLRGRVPVGVGTGDATDATAWALAQKKGAETHTLTIPQLPAHHHGDPKTTGRADGNVAGAGGLMLFGADGYTTQDTGEDQPHNNLQPSLALNFIIKT